ncbi:hypothetical protein EN45_109540 [Penicillium chrysogenum]|uniref:Uncharacterized protein n=1 Tax=Penicillium chrysogenum TaxID=5076 RepID=A0A161Z395_PENCH|nr:hypothetical protein EN45_109540 [Penicillium chrysogenum]
MLFVRQEISIHPKHKILNYASLTVGAISTSVAPSSKQYHTITNSIKQTRGSLRVPGAEPLNYSVDRAAPLARNYLTKDEIVSSSSRLPFQDYISRITIRFV